MVSFELNSKIELISSDDQKTFGLIYDIIDDKIQVSIASDDKQIKLLYVGDAVRCIAFNDSSGFAFDAKITDRIIGDLPIYELSEIRNLEEIQRREDVRVPCSMNIFYTDNSYILNLEKPVLKDIDKKYIKKYFKTGILADLSGGGLKLTCNYRFDKNDILMFELDLDNDHLFVKGEILHRDIKVTSKTSLYNYGIRFIDISEKEKDKIIRFLFVLMRRNRLK